MARGPVLIDLDAQDPAPSVADAPPVPETTSAGLPQGAALQAAAGALARRPSRLARAFWTVLAALLSAWASAAAWSFVTGWMARAPFVGWVFAGLLGVFVGLCAALVLRELAALSRLRRVDAVRHAAAEAREAADLAAAREVVKDLQRLARGRPEDRWHTDRFASLAKDQFDASGLLDLAEREMIAPRDALAAREVQAAVRQVATVTALVPVALADVVAALAANIRMIRRIAEIYGGRSGTLGSWRLLRAVFGHLVATGAVAIGDDMLEPLLGGSLLGKLSRRFGEGLVNGALTARVGVAAMEVCRPLPYAASPPPKGRDLVRKALTGLFGADS